MRHHVSTTTWTARWAYAPPNLKTILDLDTATFRRSLFCRTAFEYQPFRESRSRIRCRLYPSSQKILVTGCVSETECTEAIDRVGEAMGGAHVIDATCALMNINIDIPWTLNRHTISEMQLTPHIRLVETQERHPAVIIHIDTGSSIKKAMVYPKSGKVSLHAASWRDAYAMWSVIAPAIDTCRGITKSTTP